jgi:hypothetical protein
MLAQQPLEALTQRLLCLPVESTYEYKTRGEEQGHWGPHGAIARGGQRQGGYAGAGTGMCVGAAGWALSTYLPPYPALDLYGIITLMMQAR